MRNKHVVILFSFILLFSLTALPAFSADKVHKWKFQTANVEAEPGWFISNKALEKLIEEGSEGKVQVELYPMGALVGMEEAMGAVKNGVIEMGEFISAFAGDIVPASLVSELPYGGRNGEHCNELYYKFGLAKLLTEAYDKQAGVHYMAAPYFGYDSLITTFKVNTVDDLKGKSIWFAPHSNYLAEFGAVYTEIPGFDMYMGLKLGTIKGLMWTWDGLETYKLKEVAKYAMAPSSLLPCTHVIVNKRAWDKLGPELQKKIQNHIDANIGKVYQQVDRFANDIVVKLLNEGIQFVWPDEKSVVKLRAAARKYWDEVAAKDEFAKKGVEIYKAMLKANNIPY